MSTATKSKADAGTAKDTRYVTKLGLRKKYARNTGAVYFSVATIGADGKFDWNNHLVAFVSKGNKNMILIKEDTRPDERKSQANADSEII